MNQNRRKTEWYKWVLGGTGTLIMFILGLLANHDYDYVKRVDAKCLVLQDKKLDKTEYYNDIADIKEGQKETKVAIISTNNAIVRVEKMLYEHELNTKKRLATLNKPRVAEVPPQPWIGRDETGH